jgi:hypothetical protein
MLEAPLPDDLQRLLGDHHLAWPPDPLADDRAAEREPA